MSTMSTTANTNTNAYAKHDLRKVELTPFGEVVFERRSTCDELARIPIEKGVVEGMKDYWDTLQNQMKNANEKFGQNSYAWEMVKPPKNSPFREQQVNSNKLKITQQPRENGFGFLDLFNFNRTVAVAAGGARRNKRPSASRRPTPTKPKHSA
jgi:hypothetical protein